MPAEFKLDDAKRVVHSRAWGVLTTGDLLDHVGKLRQLFEDGTLGSDWAQIADFSATQGFDISSETIRQIAMLNPWPQESLRALITPMDIGFGLGRMYEILCGDKGANVRIVRSRAEALEWIDQHRERSKEAT